MKIYIVGSVASGKSTFAKELSKRTCVECTHLDGLIHIKDRTDKKWGNRRRSDADINQMFDDLMERQSWIVEDAGRPMFMDAMRLSDEIIHLNPSPLVRRQRILTRYIKQKLGIEKSIYTPNIRMVKFLWQCADKYDRGEDDLEKRLEKYSNKVVQLRDNKEVNNYLRAVNKEVIR